MFRYDLLEGKFLHSLEEDNKLYSILYNTYVDPCHLIGRLLVT